jgi:hypothetical protein
VLTLAFQSVEELPPIKVIKVHIQTLIKIGSKSRANDGNGYAEFSDPNKLMLKETGAGVGAETMSKNLAKDREYERSFLTLKEQFAKIDRNRDGSITIDEIVRFLNE